MRYWFVVNQYSQCKSVHVFHINFDFNYLILWNCITHLVICGSSILYCVVTVDVGFAKAHLMILSLYYVKF